jgi:voltage-gated potassium channel
MMVSKGESARIRQIVLLKIATPVVVVFFLYLATSLTVYGFETSQAREFNEEFEKAGATRTGTVIEGCEDCPREPNILRLDDALWWSTVTLGTIGYGDHYPVSLGGRLTAGAFIMTTMVFIAIVLSGIQSAVMDYNRLRWLGMTGTNLKNHVIVCGWSSISKVAIPELLAAGRQVAVICEDQNEISLIKELCGDDRQLFITVGDPTGLPALKRVNHLEAHTLIIATPEDTTNLISSLNVRLHNPELRIIVYVQRPELRTTFSASGVTYVASPFEIGGRLVASAAFEPEVAHLVDTMTSGLSDCDIQQFTVSKGSSAENMTVSEIRKEMITNDGALLIATAKKNPKKIAGEGWEVRGNPSTKKKMSAGEIIIFMGTPEENMVVSERLGVQQGR